MDEQDRLRRVTEAYGDAHVTLDEFAKLASVSPSTLGARRSRRQDFPTPVNPGERPLRFVLADLAAWSRRNPLRSDPGEATSQIQPDSPAQSRPSTTPDSWPLERAVKDCVAEHRAAPTQAFLGGLLRLVKDPAFAEFFTDAGRGDSDSQGPTLRRLRRSAAARAKEIASAEGRRGSSADREARVLAGLLDGGLTGQFDEPPIRDRSKRAMRLVQAVHRLWLAEPAQCAERVEELLLDLSHDSLELSRHTDPRLVNLLLAIAPPVRGGRFLDPACGFGSVLLAAYEQAGGELQLVGRDRDDQAWLIAKARLDARRIRHRLGRPGADSLAGDAELTPGGFDTVVVEPGGKLWDAGQWLMAAAGWINDNGTAAVELSSRTLGANRREVLMIGRSLSAVVITPRRVRPETTERMAIWVLRRTPPDDVLVIDLSDQDQRDRPLLDGEIEAVRAVLAAQRRGADPAAVPGADRLTVWRVTQDDVATLGVLGVMEGTDPFIGTVFAAEPVMDQARRGLELAEELLGLLDGTEGPGGDGPLAGLVTEEVRRAVRRLVKQLGKVVRESDPAG